MKTEYYNCYSLQNKFYGIKVIFYSLFSILTFGESEFSEAVFGETVFNESA